MPDDRVLPRARLPSWQQPVAFPWMGAQGLEAASGRAHTATACHPPVPWQGLPDTRPAHWPYRCRCGVAAAPEGSSPQFRGPGGRERPRSASDGHAMPVPGACAPSCPQGLFPWGSCIIAWASAPAMASSSFLRPLGNALRICSAPWHPEAASWPGRVPALCLWCPESIVVLRLGGRAGRVRPLAPCGLWLCVEPAQGASPELSVAAENWELCIPSQQRDWRWV